MNIYGYEISIFREKTNYESRESTIISVKTRLHSKVVLYMQNYYSHIKRRHPEVSLEMILGVLYRPDSIYVHNTFWGEYYYQKYYNNVEYRVVVIPSSYSRMVVVTAYQINSDGDLDPACTKRWRFIRETGPLNERSARYYLRIIKRYNIDFYNALIERNPNMYALPTPPIDNGIHIIQ